MKQTIATLTLVAVIISLISFVVIGSNNKNKQIADTQLNTIQTKNSEEENNTDIFYWGTTCPHCHDTIEWIDEHAIEEKMSIVRKEVYNNDVNSAELTQKARSCGIDEMNIGVPLLYTTNGDCLIGTPDIINYLSQKADSLNKPAQNATDSADIQEGGQQ